MANNISIDELKAKAVELRKNIVETTFNASSGHVGGSMSAADMLVALYFKYLNVKPEDPEWKERDRFIMSKGHCALAYVPVLAMRGYLDIEEVKANFNKTGSAYGMHPSCLLVRGCDASTGSLGHGMPMGVGMAQGLRLQKIDAKVVVMTGDGECQEGSNWEAAMAAAHWKLNNLIWIIDRNRLEIDGPTEEVMGLEPLDKKVEAFGFHCIKINGNDMAECDKALAEAWAYKDGPVCIISVTTKGIGLEDYQGKYTSHYISFGASHKDIEHHFDYIDAHKDDIGKISAETPVQGK
ncbi:MAG: transketolase [Clostridia bacterium]|nr:transketolase [Clostridia bacterium]